MGPRALVAVGVSIAAAACAHVKTEPPLSVDAAEHARASMRVVAREYLDAYFRWRPEDATLFFVQGADDAAVQDPSAAALAAWRATEDDFLNRVRALDPRALDGSREGEAHRVLREGLEASQGARVCRLELWTVSATNGWQREYANLAWNQPMGTPARRTAAVARVAALARRLTGEIENLREGVRLGFVATRDDVVQVVEELDRLLATPSDRWPQANPHARDEYSVVKAALIVVIDRELVPAAARYRDYLRDEYIGHARHPTSLLELPGGDACERASIRLQQVLELGPSDLHASRVWRAQALRYALLDVANVRPAVWVNYGTSLHFAGRYQESVRAYDRALALGFDPDVPIELVVRNTALALARLKAYDEARVRLEAYLAKAPRDAATWVVLALSRSKRTTWRRLRKPRGRHWRSIRAYPGGSRSLRRCRRSEATSRVPSTTGSRRRALILPIRFPPIPSGALRKSGAISTKRAAPTTARVALFAGPARGSPPYRLTIGSAALVSPVRRCLRWGSCPSAGLPRARHSGHDITSPPMSPPK
jgi:tetratricopeptide (TPR) repeat protein